MFDLVDDIERYPEFLPWCRRATVQRRTGDQVEATVEVGLRGVRKAFSTRNKLESPQRIDMRLLKGPFRSLEGTWAFEESADGCEVSLSLDFEVSNTPLDLLFSTIFEEIVKSQIAAFTKRAEDLYG